MAELGRDHDPARSAGFEFFADMHHADRTPAAEDEIRSELVGVMADGGGSTVLAGFLGGHEHDGTLRLRQTHGGGVELCAEAFFGGAVLVGAESRSLHPVAVSRDGEPETMMAAWARAFGAASDARTTAPYQLGWCSWYHYFERVTEADIRANLALAGDWPFEVFQVDDGYQSQIGDWLTTNDTFPTGVEGLATSIADAGYTPGIWLAPFIASPESAFVRDHPEMLAGAPDGDGPLVNMFNDIWGGFMYGLDTSAPETLAHIEDVARQLVEVGYDYLKLDFTFAPKIHGRFRDMGMTPAQRVRAGYEAVRRGAGEDTFLLACGCPIGSVVGVVDGMRVGPDVAPRWGLAPTTEPTDPYAWAFPSTRAAWRSTAIRSSMHRNLWLNDPDCLMLRTSETELTPDQARTWAHVVGVSGGMAIVSDDLSLLGPAERALLDEVVTLGREADRAATEGTPPTTDLLSDEPTELRSGGTHLDLNPKTGHSTHHRDA